MNPDSFDSDNLLLGIKLRTFLLKFALCNFSFSILFSEKILQCHIFLFSNWKGFKLKNYYICFTHLLFFKKEIWLGTKYMWKTFLSPEIHLKNRTETQLTMNRRKKKKVFLIFTDAVTSNYHCIAESLCGISEYI